MSTKRHPVTGVEMNDIVIRRSSLRTDDLRRTARLLRAEGDPRWLAAARLGVHPLELDPGEGTEAAGRKPSGSTLSASAAAQDPRQDELWDWPGDASAMP